MAYLHHLPPAWLSETLNFRASVHHLLNGSPLFKGCQKSQELISVKEWRYVGYTDLAEGRDYFRADCQLLGSSF